MFKNYIQSIVFFNQRICYNFQKILNIQKRRWDMHSFSFSDYFPIIGLGIIASLLFASLMDAIVDFFSEFF